MPSIKVVVFEVTYNTGRAQCVLFGIYDYFLAFSKKDFLKRRVLRMLAVIL